MAGNFALGLQAGAPVGQAAVNAYLGAQRNTRDQAKHEYEMKDAARNEQIAQNQFDAGAELQSVLNDPAAYVQDLYQKNYGKMGEGDHAGKSMRVERDKNGSYWVWATDAEGKQASEPEQYSPQQIQQAAQKQFMERVYAFNPKMMQQESQFGRELGQRGEQFKQGLDQKAAQHGDMMNRHDLDRADRLRIAELNDARMRELAAASRAGGGRSSQYEPIGVTKEGQVVYRQPGAMGHFVDDGTGKPVRYTGGLDKIKGFRAEADTKPMSPKDRLEAEAKFSEYAAANKLSPADQEIYRRSFGLPPLMGGDNPMLNLKLPGEKNGSGAGLPYTGQSLSPRINPYGTAGALERRKAELEAIVGDQGNPILERRKAQAELDSILR